MNKINILGINVSTLTKDEVLRELNNFLTDGKQHQIATPNPEFLLEAHHNEEFFYILNKADLALPDGIGLKFAGWLSGKNIHRITGADLVKNILEELRITNYELRIGIINWKDGLSGKEDIEKVLQKYNIKKYFIKNIGREEIKLSVEDLISIKNFEPNILFATLGAPWQEKFIYRNLPQLPSVKIGMGVGGAFDFLTGKIKRAPKFMRAIGLEWLWRLSVLFFNYTFNTDQAEYFMQRRMKRIYNAVIVFPWQFFKWKFVLPFFYRPNVSCLLYKKEGAKIKILLVERKDEPGHWQLPQGGTDGEDIETAGTRELSEELRTDKFKHIATFKNLWKYRFNSKIGKYKSSNRMGYKGQTQNLYIAEFIGNDNDIKINFWEHINWKWVDSENLINEVHPVRQDAMKIFFSKFKEII